MQVARWRRAVDRTNGPRKGALADRKGVANLGNVAEFPQIGARGILETLDDLLIAMRCRHGE
jgi:hypothetical protein